MSLIEMHTNHGNVIGCDIDGMFIPGHIGRQLDEQLNPEDYDSQGYKLTPYEVVHIAGSMTIDLAQSS